MKDAKTTEIAVSTPGAGERPISRNATGARALGLCSGGLDSILAAVVLREQGVGVEWITFETPFFSSAKAREAARMIDVPLTVENITPVYLEMLRNPNVGYGKNMNPCMDCHALMFKLAGGCMADRGADFLFSGEVLGQRPMSQNRSALRYVEKRSGFDGLILRPLSAKCLPETVPEQRGLVQREKLLDITGRSRKPQIRLAEAYGIDRYPAPAGGCLLTDRGYADRLRDLFAHRRVTPERDLNLLKHGRHLRLAENAKAVVGRTRHDNEQIQRYIDPDHDTVLHAVDFPGPTVLITEECDRAAVLLAAAITAGYGKAPNDRRARVNISYPWGRETVEVRPMPPAAAKHYII